ncbi:hypothetical protein B0H15DRAFT_798830 [Mycena belliarum]|uniref:Uncharacterized protein n=1 Tax=Mycena belliarum TaxID=1033014 RepID=A0AAD6UER1_9AGAR|nr:hypothetical protein B0H15DRAFT_798830 [Mycena belliae]
MPLTFGTPDSSILSSMPAGGTDFTMFKFKSIGKEPELLKRISSREEGVSYQHSPSPEPEPYLTPYASEARTRPSLLQALTNHATTSLSREPEGFPVASSSSQREPPLSPTAEVPSESPSLNYELQYPDKPAAANVAPHKSPLAPPQTPFIPNYVALKELHMRLETSHKVLAAPPPATKAPPPPHDFPRPSLIAANNAVHHSEKTHTSAKEALKASQTRVSTSEQSVAAAQTIVDTLSQALVASRAALEAAQKSLVEARQAAEEAQAALMESRVAADAAEETKRLLEEPLPPRAPTPEPSNDNREVIGEMQKDLDALKLWVEVQEAGHVPLPVVGRDTSRDREEEEEREASLMVVPDDTDTDVEVHNANGIFENFPRVDGGDVDMDADRVLEVDAAESLMALADQKAICKNKQSQNRAPSPKSLEEKGRPELLRDPAAVERPHLDEAPEDSLAREATLRKLQEVQRQRIRIQKEQAQAAAALSILKERQSAAARISTSVPPSNTSILDVKLQHGNVSARAVVLPPSTAAEAKVKTKKPKAMSGGVRLGLDIVTVKADPDPSIPSDPSPALERAAALGLRVRPPVHVGGTHSAPSSKAGPSKAGPSKKMRNYSLPPIIHFERDSSSPEEFSACRTGSDEGDIPIIQPTKAPKLPLELSTDIQLINLRFALQEKGITWEAISKSRPKLPVVKAEAPDDALRPVQPASPAIQTTNIAPPQPPLQVKSHISSPTPGPPMVASAVLMGPLKPLPSRKQLPKFNKTTPLAASNNNQSVKPATSQPPASQPLAMPASTLNMQKQSRPFPAAPISSPPQQSPPAVAIPNLTSDTSLRHADLPEAPALPDTQTNAFSHSSTPATEAPSPDTSGSNYRPLTERVSDVRRRPSPPLYNTRSPRPRSRTPERYKGTSNPYKSEPARYDRRTPDPFRRTPDPFSRYSSPKWTPGWMPEPVRKPPTPPRLYTPPRTQRPASPPLRRRDDHPPQRPFSDRYSPGSPARPWTRHDSPPTGPRHGAPRVPSNPQKRSREDDYTAPIHPQKRFKNEGRDAARARPASPPRSWPAREAETERPSLEHRLGAPDPGVHFIGRGESYRPPADFSDEHNDERSHKPTEGQGLLSRLSDPTARGSARGRGGPRGRANNRGRGRGRGERTERSLADRME